MIIKATPRPSNTVLRSFPFFGSPFEEYTSHTPNNAMILRILIAANDPNAPPKPALKEFPTRPILIVHVEKNTKNPLLILAFYFPCGIILLE